MAKLIEKPKNLSIHGKQLHDELEQLEKSLLEEKEILINHSNQYTEAFGIGNNLYYDTYWFLSIIGKIKEPDKEEFCHFLKVTIEPKIFGFYVINSSFSNGWAQLIICECDDERINRRSQFEQGRNYIDELWHQRVVEELRRTEVQS